MAIHLFHSLKEKVLIGYLIGFLLMLGAILVNLRNFTEMQSVVLKGEKVSELIDTILEVRRYEKNYFLYGKQEDLDELRQYLGRLDTILRGAQEDMGSFVQKDLILQLKKDIAEYEKLLGHLKESTNQNMAYWEDKIRNKGRDIAKNAEAIGEIKRKRIMDNLVSSRNILIGSIIFLASAGFIAGAIFYRSFAKPLVLFEKHMKRIAEGEYTFIPAPSRDREMLSLSKAFNRMLVELELRQSHLIQAERLASFGTLFLA